MTITKQLVTALREIEAVARQYDVDGGPAWAMRKIARSALADYEASKNRPRPTIAELEAILNSESTEPVQILPDGSITDYEANNARYRCPVCDSADENFYLRCNYQGCPDGRDPRPSEAPGHTDLMVTPESIDSWLEHNPPHSENGDE